MCGGSSTDGAGTYVAELHGRIDVCAASEPSVAAAPPARRALGPAPLSSASISSGVASNRSSTSCSAPSFREPPSGLEHATTDEPERPDEADARCRRHEARTVATRVGEQLVEPGPLASLAPRRAPSSTSGSGRRRPAAHPCADRREQRAPAARRASGPRGRCRRSPASRAHAGSRRARRAASSPAARTSSSDSAPRRALHDLVEVAAHRRRWQATHRRASAATSAASMPHSDVARNSRPDAMSKPAVLEVERRDRERSGRRRERCDRRARRRSRLSRSSAAARGSRRRSADVPRRTTARPPRATSRRRACAPRPARSRARLPNRRVRSSSRASR